MSITTHAGEEHYFETKSAKPNKGQCIEMKQRLLTALAMRCSERVFVWWGVPYNPYGTAAAYAHPYPKRFFDFERDVKLGPQFWTLSAVTSRRIEGVLSLYRRAVEEYTAQLDASRTALAGRAV